MPDPQLLRAVMRQVLRNARERELLRNLHTHQENIIQLLKQVDADTGLENLVYRFYHQSWKTYGAQEDTRRITALLERLAPQGCSLTRWYRHIVTEGTSHGSFQPGDNRHWEAITRPMLEAYFHATYFLRMAAKYSAEPEPPRPLPYGYAALLELYGIR